MLLWLLEFIGWNAFKAWWNRDKTQEAVDAENKVSSMSDAAVSKRLSDNWTKH